MEIELEILVAIISPNLEIDIFLNLNEFLDKDIFEGESDFQNLNKNPTVIQAKICANKRRKPIFESPNMLNPTVPTIKRGPRVISKTK